MRWLRLITWLATAAVLILVSILAPRLTPASDVDPFPDRVTLDEPAEISGGTVSVARVLAAPRWTDGDDKFSLEGKGFFVEVRARANPDRRATLLRAKIRSNGRTYESSDRVGFASEPAPVGFMSPQVITFEVPTDVLDDGSVWLHFNEGSSARMSLNADTVERAAVLEQAP